MSKEVDTIGVRLRFLRENSLFLSREKFVEDLGVAAKTLERYENDETSPDSKFLTRMWSKYSNKLSSGDLDWLLTGRRIEYAAAEPTPVLGRVPAGFPKDVASEDISEYVSLPDTPKGAYALIVDGASMAPEIKDGDYVVFLPVDRADVTPGDIVVINDEFGRTMIKRYVVKDGKPYLKSDNPEYPTFEPNEHYRIVGKVIDVWSRKKIRKNP